MKGYGLWIAIGVILAIAVGCLIDGEFQAFGGAILVAALLAFFALRKRKQPTVKAPKEEVLKKQPHQVTPPQPTQNPVAPDPEQATVTIHADLDGSSGTFGCWGISVHDAVGQDVRFDRALFQNLVIASYDAKTGVADIFGSRGNLYATTLDTCTCEDFQRRGLPCKHIYKLALSRGYSADAFFSARSDVVWYADRCRVYHAYPECRGLQNRIARRTTVTMAEYQGLRPCKSCSDE